MEKRKLNKVSKFLISTFFLVFIILFVFQMFLIPGIAWNIFKYPVIIVSFISIFLASKYSNTKNIKKVAILLIIFGLAEITWVKINEHSLKTNNQDTELTIMTYNLFFKNRYANQSIKIIKKANPDILFLQELTPKWNSKLMKSIGNKYPYKSTIILEGTHGIGIYSKYKITNKKTLNNSSKKPYAQVVDIKINKKIIQFTNVHLASPAIAVENRDRFLSLYHQNYNLRKKQLNRINEYCFTNSNDYKTRFLIGDLNTIKYEPIFKKLTYNWTNIYDKVGNGFGFNFPNSSKLEPVLTLDYILANGNVKAINSEVLKGGSSDHLAIIAKIKI